MDYKLEAFLNTTRSANSLAELFPAYDRFMASLGFDRIAYAITNHHEALNNTHPLGIVAMNSLNGWDDYYQENDYSKIDPIAHITQFQHGIFHWGRMAKKKGLSNRQVDFFRQVEHEAQLFQGASFSIHGPNATKGVALACSTNRVDRLDPTAYEIANMATYHLHSSHIALKNIARKITADLSIRERDVLCWAARGLTVNQIADRLNVSAHTIDYYLRHIKAKLGASNTTAAVAIAITDGIISL